jgi:NDP-sugar pyrophosphorylase family protein
MILAAGRGTRLGDLGRKIPKVLLEVGGEPLLGRHLRYLEREGIRRVVVNAHHLGDDVRRFAGGYRGSLEVRVVAEPVLLGTAGGVRNALPHLGTGPFVVLYGDVLIDVPLGPIVAAHRAARASLTLTVYASGSTVGKGVVDVDGQGRVVAFAEKRTAGPGLVNAGLYVVERSFVAGLRPGEALDFGHDVLPQAVAGGEQVFAYRLPEPVIDIGTPETLARVRMGAPA